MGVWKVRKELAKEELTAWCAAHGGVWPTGDRSWGQQSNLVPDLSTKECM